MSPQSTYDTGESGGNGRVFFGPKYYVPAGNTVRGVIFAHPYGFTALNTIDGGGPGPQTAAIVQAIASVYPLVSCDLGQQQWGNATAVARMTDAFTFLTTTWGAKTDKVLLVAESMGNLAVMNWARANKAKVAGILSVIPVSDTNDMVVNNRGGFASNINVAYSTWNQSTMGATYNPTTYAATDLAGVPVKLYYASDDAIVVPSTVTGLATAIGATASTVNIGTGGHADSTLAAVDKASVLAFLAAIA